MCGIAALFAAQPRPLGNLIGAMCRVVRHRGPDDEGFTLFEAKDLTPQALGGIDTPAEVYESAHAFSPSGTLSELDGRLCLAALGHRRLSIVELSSLGHQPMSDVQRRYWVSYNGEIYNHIELRRELEALGHRFLSHSDTEVLLHAYREWGQGCLRRFNGMFAFVLVDRVTRRVFAARDRFGVKPLYLWRAPGSGLVAMASEIKQFSVLPGWKAAVNGQRAYEFLNWELLDHSAQTLFEGVLQLRGGELVHCDLEELGRGFPVRRWYELKPAAFTGSFEEATREFAELFADAVRLRLRADVPVGSCLSGGLDSSSIVCVANAILRESDAQAQQRTFSACATVKRYDEREFIDTVVALTGVEARYTYPSLPDLSRNLDAIVWHQDEPFGSTSIYAQWEVFALAAQARVKVLLDGQGADELLAGYHGFFAPHLAGLLRSHRWASLLREMHAASRHHAFGLSGSLKYLANALLPQSLRQPLRRMAGKPAKAPRWIDASRLDFEDRDPWLEYGFKTHSVNAMSCSMLSTTSVPMLLHWEDRNSMAHSVESRLPFLDYRLVEYALGIPAEFKLHDATTKRMLREGLRGVLPEKVRTRMDKMGFVTPEEVWTRKEGPELFRAELRRAIDASLGVIRASALDRLEAVIAGTEPFSFTMWRMISFGRWMERFGVCR